jgi:hypothetical protein
MENEISTKEIAYLTEQLTQYPIHGLSSDERKKCITLIDKIIFSTRRNTKDTLTEVLREVESIKESTQLLYYDYEVELEYQAGNQIEELVSRTQYTIRDIFNTYPQLMRTFHYAKKELEITDSFQNIMHIGSGPCPESLLAMQKICEEKKDIYALTGVDVDRKACILSHKIITELEVAHAIKIINKEASLVDYGEYTDIVTAIMVRPEIETIKQICKTTEDSEETRLYIRNVDQIGSLAYVPICEESYQLLEAAGYKKQREIRGHTILHTEVFIKE